MRRRDFFSTFAFGAILTPLAARAQQKAMPAVQKEPPFELQLVEAARAHEIRDHGIHRRLL